MSRHRTLAEFVEAVTSCMESEHGAETDTFVYLEPRIERAYSTEGQISNDDLITLCCGDEDGEIPPVLEERYPLLTAVFEAPFMEPDEEERRGRTLH